MSNTATLVTSLVSCFRYLLEQCTRMCFLFIREDVVFKPLPYLDMDSYLPSPYVTLNVANNWYPGSNATVVCTGFWEITIKAIIYHFILLAFRRYQKFILSKCSFADNYDPIKMWFSHQKVIFLSKCDFPHCTPTIILNIPTSKANSYKLKLNMCYVFGKNYAKDKFLLSVIHCNTQSLLQINRRSISTKLSGLSIAWWAI